MLSVEFNLKVITVSDGSAIVLSKFLYSNVLINFSLQFYIHASGPTIGKALAEFRRIFAGYLDVLSAEEENLDAYMLDQLQYLRSSIVRM